MNIHLDGESLVTDSWTVGDMSYAVRKGAAEP